MEVNVGLIDPDYRSELLDNPNVERVKNSHITYTTDFKLSALEDFKNGISAPDIWETNGFDISRFPRNYFGKAIHRWEKQLRRDGASFNARENRGRAQKKKFKSIEEEVAYLRAENAFLKELKALDGAYQNGNDTK